MNEQEKPVREWVRNADFCDAARELRGKGYSRKQIRTKLKERFAIKSPVALSTISEAIKDGPIKILRETSI